MPARPLPAALRIEGRQAFSGAEAQRIPRGREDVKVMVRYPRSERDSLADLENLRIRLPDGRAVAFDEVAEIQFGESYTTINRMEQERVVNITADADKESVDVQYINATRPPTDRARPQANCNA